MKSNAQPQSGGVDLRLSRNGRRTLVQCKRWKKNVGAPVVRELFGILQSERAVRAVLVNTSGFTREAIAFAQGKPIELIDGPTLLTRIRHVQPSPDPSRIQSTDEDRSEPINTMRATTPPTCPKWGGEMLQRTAQRRPNAGSTFWGCRSFPKCRGTVT